MSASRCCCSSPLRPAARRGGSAGEDWVTLLASRCVLAAVYLLGTVLEKRHAADRPGFDPRPYSAWWLGCVCLLWLLLVWASADFVWLAFPLFFLQLHVLPAAAGAAGDRAEHRAGHRGAVVPQRRGQRAAGALQLPMVLGPAFGAAFAVVTGLAYRALFLEAENQRLAAEELRRTRAELARTPARRRHAWPSATRLAREIHDTLAQGLSSIVLMGRAAEKALDDGDTAVAGTGSAQSRRRPRPTWPRPATLSAASQPPDLEDGSLVAGSLRRLCEKTETEAAARGAGLRCRFDARRVAGGTARRRTRRTLLRAAQASLANVWVHAKASTAVVTLSFLGSEVAMDIYDDGAGFDPSAAVARLRAPDGSRLRADVAAGTGGRAERQLDIESAPGEGTVVAIRLPLGAGAGFRRRVAQPGGEQP